MKSVPEDVRNYLLGAQKAALQWSLPDNRGNYQNAKPIDIQTVCVIGGGTMGRGIAIAFCSNGFKTILVELDEQSVRNCRQQLEITFSREKSLKRLDDATHQMLNDNLHITTDFGTLTDCDLVIEAVFEDMKLKKSIFSKLDSVCKPSCVLGTNTSSLNLDEISSAIRDPSRLVGIHFFNPANLIRMVEVVYGSRTSSVSVATAFSACQSIQKLPVLVGNCPAFVFNRLLAVYMEQSLKLAHQYGFLPQRIDKIVTNRGFLMGPLTVADMNGLDVMEKLKSENGWSSNLLEKEMWKRKRYGRKTGKGFYKYDKKTHKKEADPEVEQLIRTISQQSRPKIQIVSDQDALNFLLYPMMNEGFLCIEEGMIGREDLIDIMFMLGFGWPVTSGGPMRFGRGEGIRKVADTIVLWNILEPKQREYKVSETLNKVHTSNQFSSKF